MQARTDAYAYGPLRDVRITDCGSFCLSDGSPTGQVPETFLRGPAPSAREVATAQGLSVHSRDAIVASATLARASDSGLLRQLGFTRHELGASSLLLELRGESDAMGALMLYCAGQRARLADSQCLVCVVGADGVVSARELGFELMPVRRPDRAPGIAMCARLDVLMQRAYVASRNAGHAPSGSFMLREVREMVESWLRTYPRWAFFEAVHAGALARAQYVYALSNLHQYVRYTTRLVARAVAHAHDLGVRNTFLDFLKQEINHELWLESDLAYLGEDVGFVTGQMVPCVATQEFMAIQESMSAFYQDPILLLASPLAAEGLGAHLDQRFVSSLLGCVSRWGFSEPERACRCYIEHIDTDGGQDGHWEAKLQFLASHVRDEQRLQRFLNTCRCSMRSLQRMYGAFVDDLAIWGTPQGEQA
ncbi:MAG: hypothetical protein OXR73_28000 [Myxococcales bacterium]|nr:hypothetical protein [Myxococcales bacterium]